MVEQRVTDGFINGTMMCVAHGKDMSDWLKTDGTWDLVTALAKDLEIGSAQSKNHKSGNSVFTRVTATYPDLVTSKQKPQKWQFSIYRGFSHLPWQQRSQSD